MEHENPFKKIGIPTQKVPSDLRRKVMDDVNTAKFIMEVTSLFSDNFASSLESLFKTKPKNNKK